MRPSSRREIANRAAGLDVLDLASVFYKPSCLPLCFVLVRDRKYMDFLGPKMHLRDSPKCPFVC
jgi:hypothetical protein